LCRYFEANPPFPDAHRENQGTHHAAQPQQTTPGSQLRSDQKVDRGKEKRKREEREIK